MKVAVIGSGVAGLVAARELQRDHAVTVFEAAGHVGGHVNTRRVTLHGRQWAVDTGFIVFNPRTYPNFCALLDQLEVASQPAPMSFSVRCETSGLEYAGTSLNTLFAQRRNLVSPRFLGMLRDILRFSRRAPEVLTRRTCTATLGEYLREGGYGQAFVNHYIVPMGAAIWSTDPQRMLDFPADTFIRFFVNHGLLELNDRPQWRVIRGGSAAYVERLIRPFADRIRTGCPVLQVRRQADGVHLRSAAGHERFDAVFMACHSDQALALLDSPTTLEREVLGAIAFQPCEAVLHTDARLLPRTRRAWAAWNYHAHSPDSPVRLTYLMNRLQSLDAPQPLLVTLNDSAAIDPALVLDRVKYAHPVFTARAVAAQARHGELNAAGGVYYCGAWWGYGFHEDGVTSALQAVARFRRHAQREQPRLQRTA